MYKENKILLPPFIAVTFFIIYFFFFPWKTGTAYGDDLYMFKTYYSLQGFWNKIDLPLSFGKFRPIHGIVTHFLISCFKDDVHAYYVFNIAIQALNTFILALIANRFLRSPLLSLLIGLTFGLSRFAYFNISQLLNGGALEGLAMSFFLFTIYFLIKGLDKETSEIKSNSKSILLSLLFANLAMYTHERYVFLVVFIGVALFLSPVSGRFSFKPKILLLSLPIISVALNVLLKKLVYNMPFFVGTGGTNISFSFKSALKYLTDGVLSIFQFNSGPEYLVGIKFSALDIFPKALVIASALTLLSIVLYYLISKSKSASLNYKHDKNHFSLVLLLILLFGLSLAPAIVTIRLEQRWLQAPAVSLILIMIVAISGLNVSNKARTILVIGFSFVSIFIENNYLKKGASNIYLTNAENIASNFRNAISMGKISPSVSALYLLEQQRNQNSENSIRWQLGGGYLFDFYQKREKIIFFIDTTYKALVNPADSLIQSNDTIQIVALSSGNLDDVTNQFLPVQSGLKYLIKMVVIPKIAADTDLFAINHSDIDKFSTTGFYADESGFRWTNGSASIDINSGFLKKDTLSLALTTYLPQVSKEVTPKITLIDTSNNVIPSFFSDRKADTFYFKFQFPANVLVAKIKIESQTIPVTPPDKRVLSFPFINLEMRKN